MSFGSNFKTLSVEKEDICNYQPVISLWKFTTPPKIYWAIVNILFENEVIQMPGLSFVWKYIARYTYRPGIQQFHKTV